MIIIHFLVFKYDDFGEDDAYNRETRQFNSENDDNDNNDDENDELFYDDFGGVIEEFDRQDR